MALTRLGTNSITALPSGVVDSAALASGVGGKVLQVVQSQSNTTYTTTSTSASATGYTVSITPSSTSNKILVNFDLGGIRIYSNTWMRMRLYRQINGGGYSSIKTLEDGYGYTIGSDHTSSKSFSYLDTSHSTTNQIDYQLYAWIAGSMGRICVDGVELTSVTAMEIAG